MQYVRPVAICGAKCRPATKSTDQTLNLMEMNILRWPLGVTRLDHIPKQSIRVADSAICLAFARVPRKQPKGCLTSMAMSAVVTLPAWLNEHSISSYQE